MYSPLKLELMLLSNSFVDMLQKYDNSIAKQLLRINGLGYFKDSTRNITLRRNKTMSYCPKGKETVLNEDQNKWSKNNRQEGKYGKLIRKVLKEQVPRFKYTDKDVENLVNMLKAEVSDGVFSIVKGEDISKWYNTEKMEGHGSLTASCMQGKPKNFFEIYEKNEDVISMVVLVKNQNELIGRALVWDIDGDKYMDRMYGSDHTIQKFKDYAKTNSLIRKTVQSYDNREQWTLLNGEEVYRSLSINLDTEHDSYPYMDTFSFKNGNELSNNEDCEHEYKLTSTGGEEEDDDYVTCEGSGERMHIDDSCYIEGEGHYHQDYVVYDDLNNEYILENDSITIYGGNTTHESNEDIVHCDSDGEHAHIDDVFHCEWSEEYYLIDKHDYENLEELCITVHTDHVQEAYENEGYVFDEENDKWVLEADLESKAA